MNVQYKQWVGFMVLALMSANSWAVDFNPGMWEWKTTMEYKDLPAEMAGMMPSGPQTQTQTACEKEVDIQPTQKEYPGCTIEQPETSGNTVTWKVECKRQGASERHEGEMHFHGDTADGLIRSEAGAMTMEIKMQGRRLGDCKD